MNTNPTPELFPALASIWNTRQFSEIMVDGYSRVYVEHRGQLEDVPTPYRDDEQLTQEIMAFAAYMGRTVNADNPILEGWLPDGSWVNVVLPPVSPIGPTMHIRLFAQTPFTVDDLLRFGAWDESIVTFLRACVQSKLNIAVAGDMFSGKTTVLNIVAGMSDSNERVINIGGELRLRHKYGLLLNTRPADANGKGAVTMTDLVHTALHMRADRLILTEARGPEVLPFLEALAMGYDGSMLTLQARDSRDALSRLEVMASMGNVSLPLIVIREFIVSGIQLVLHQSRLRDGGRRLVKITEIVGLHGDVVELQDIFVFQQTGYTDNKITGYFTPTGLIPRCMERLQNANQNISLDLFTPRSA